eukprot:CAMPEP_0185194776 /NCGR_PEP_ID=MMETSP1140-20130426/32212_1 /TAXON_ID=298111 /ORGANISM="Pavlova sp., Strain CCMP459" /LENGTH=75 /DNA_ID=CAMNT_0027761723 /DNA_START=60 /DNA_END=283 /DNA_ORIENTATION=-
MSVVGPSRVRSRTPCHARAPPPRSSARLPVPSSRIVAVVSQHSSAPPSLLQRVRLSPCHHVRAFQLGGLVRAAAA